MSPENKIPAVGILGGCFNPVHNGHLSIAQSALEHFNLQKVIFIPAGMPPHKEISAGLSARHRMNMLKIAVSSNPHFSILGLELRRKGKSYTVDTLRFLTARYPLTKKYFIIGSDNLGEIVTWKQYKIILKMVTLAVTCRPGYSMRIPVELKSAEIETFTSPKLDISSSLVRENLQKGFSCRYLADSRVLEYIDRHGLYR